MDGQPRHVNRFAARVGVRQLAASALLVLVACGPARTSTVNGHVVDPPFRVDHASLRTTDGRPFSLTSARTRLTLVFFGYTKCPDICPAVLASLTAGLAKLTDSQRSNVTTVFVSSDPDHDSAMVLRRYLDHFDPRIVGLRGPLATTAAIANSVGIYVDPGGRLPGRGNDPNSHSTYVIAIDETHRAPLFWRSDTSPSQFAHDIRILLSR